MKISHINPQVGDVVELWRQIGRVRTQEQIAIIEDVRKWTTRGLCPARTKKITLSLREISFNGNPSTPQTPGHRFEVASTYHGNRKICKLPAAEAAVILVHES
jgi:hypothetical protein